MSINPMSSKELLLAVVPGEDGESVVRHAMVNHRRIATIGEGVPSRFSGPMRVSVFSPDSYFEQTDLAAASVKLLPLVARRHIDSELVFDDTAYRLRVRSRSKRERTIATDIVAMPEHDLETAISRLPLLRRPCVQLVPLELAIAALVNKVTSDPVIVFWEKGGELISLLVAGGMVQTRMRERVAGDNREAIISRAEASLKASTSRSGESPEISLILYTGDLTNQDRAGRAKASCTLEEKLARLYRGSREVGKDAVLRDPELYGLPFVAAEWNLLEARYRAQVLSWQYARPAAAVAGVAGVLVALYGGLLHLQALNIASGFDRARVELNADLAEFERNRPSDEAMAAVRSRLQVQQQSLSEVRLDRILEWLTHLVPEGVVISSFEMVPAPTPRQRNPAVPAQWPVEDRPFEVKMEFVLAETVLDAAEASAAEVVRRLSQKLHMVDSRLQVPAPEPGIHRNVVLVIRANALAESFI